MFLTALPQNNLTLKVKYLLFKALFRKKKENLKFFYFVFFQDEWDYFQNKDVFFFNLFFKDITQEMLMIFIEKNTIKFPKTLIITF